MGKFEWKIGKNLAGPQAAVWTEGAQAAIIIAFIAIPAICNVICMVIMHFYDLDKKCLKIKAELMGRRKQMTKVTNKNRYANNTICF